MGGQSDDETDEQTGLADYGDEQADMETGDGEVIWPPNAGEDE